VKEEKEPSTSILCIFCSSNWSLDSIAYPIVARHAYEDF
jgi:hypothetical protein